MDFRIFGNLPAKIEVLTRKFQRMSIIQDPAKIENANFEGAKIEVRIWKNKLKIDKNSMNFGGCCRSDF